MFVQKLIHLRQFRLPLFFLMIFNHFDFFCSKRNVSSSSMVSAKDNYPHVLDNALHYSVLLRLTMNQVLPQNRSNRFPLNHIFFYQILIGLLHFQFWINSSVNFFRSFKSFSCQSTLYKISLSVEKSFYFSLSLTDGRLLPCSGK
jgi:hypothetical protein